MNFSSTVICGRIGQHAPSTKQAGNTSYAGFTVAVNHGYGDRKTTTWYHVRLWGKAGEFFAQYGEPGQEVLLRGEHRCERWDDRSTGQKKEQWVLHCWEGELGEKPRQRNSGGGQRRPATDTNDYGAGGTVDASTDDIPF